MDLTQNIMNIYNSKSEKNNKKHSSNNIKAKVIVNKELHET